MLCRPCVHVTASSNCQTWSSKLWVLSPDPRLLTVVLAKLRARSPSRPEGLPLPIPMVLPNCPTPEAQQLPLLSVTWLQPTRASLTRLLPINRVQSPSVLSVGADAEEKNKRTC